MWPPRVLVIVSVALLATACGGGDITVSADPTATVVAAVSPEPTAGPTSGPEASATPEEGDDAETAATPTPLPSPTTQPTATPEPAPVGVAETVVVTYQSNSFGFEDEMVATFARDGSYRIDYADGSIDVRDAPGERQTSYFVLDDDVSIAETRGIGLGPPDLYHGFFLPGFPEIDHVLSQAGTAAAGEGELLGRQAVVYEADVVPNAIAGGPDRITMAIDAETGLVLDYLATFEGEEQSALVATSFEVFSDRLDVFTLPPDTPAADFTFDQGFQRATLDQVAGLVGYEPVLPAVVPDGYVLDAVAVAPGQTDNFTGVEASNPPSVDLVHIRYRNGWRTFTITTRRVGDQPDFWVDPFSGEGRFYDIVDVEVTGPSFLGEVAQLSTSPETVPHLWVQGSDLVFTVAGPLREAELIAVVDSLEPA